MKLDIMLKKLDFHQYGEKFELNIEDKIQIRISEREYEDLKKLFPFEVEQFPFNPGSPLRESCI